ncbi:MAG: peptidoglycan DD-metalloendopeptidase family protein [Candidatus Polarisedimenticolaceae bacterium]|nr:peptidoglycan DD-metalloendopeptidase family protein [Candidatus Polarisedimenticolaceae bacterium]
MILFVTAIYADFDNQTVPTETIHISADSSSSITVKLTLPPPFEEMSRAEIAPPPHPKTVETEVITANTDRPIEIAEVIEEPSTWLTHTVKSGDTLAKIFSAKGLSANLLHRIVTSSKESAKLARIRPGQELRIQLDAEGEFIALVQVIDAIHSLEIRRTTEGFIANKVQQAVEYRTAFTSGTITQSLFISAKEAGLPDPLIMSLANIFGWDIDFALEIRQGDRFTVIYREEYLNGKKLRNGPILAAEFINRGKSFQAIRYTDAAGESNYFTPEGDSVRKAFLRSPVDFRRISSRFQRERYHPVLGRKRPHRGVDYAARTGTPVKASGDGKIIFRGRKGGYGKTVIVQHGGGITTLYAHLNSYMLKRRVGSRVKQGQTIGFVGKTGVATGPHLHYEFRLNGAHRNPLTVKLPAANPIAKAMREDFKIQTAPLTMQLATLNRTLLADARP